MTGENLPVAPDEVEAQVSPKAKRRADAEVVVRRALVGWVITVGVFLALAGVGVHAYIQQGESLTKVSSALDVRNKAVKDLSHDNKVLTCKNNSFGTWADDLKAMLVAPRDSPEQVVAFEEFKGLPSLKDLYNLCNKL